MSQPDRTGGHQRAHPDRDWWIRSRLWLSTVLRLVLAGVFGVAGALKLPDPAESVRAVRAYDLLPEGGVQVVGYGLPVFEVALALLLVLGLATRLAAGLSAGLLVLFLVGIVSAAARGLSIDCGCFGGGGEVAEGETAYTAEIVRDSLLLGAALVLMRWPASRLSVDRLLRLPDAHPVPNPDHLDAGLDADVAADPDHHLDSDLDAVRTPEPKDAR